MYAAWIPALGAHSQSSASTISSTSWTVPPARSHCAGVWGPSAMSSDCGVAKNPAALCQDHLGVMTWMISVSPGRSFEGDPAWSCHVGNRSRPDISIAKRSPSATAARTASSFQPRKRVTTSNEPVLAQQPPLSCANLQASPVHGSRSLGPLFSSEGARFDEEADFVRRQPLQRDRLQREQEVRECFEKVVGIVRQSGNGFSEAPDGRLRDPRCLRFRPGFVGGVGVRHDSNVRIPRGGRQD